MTTPTLTKGDAQRMALYMAEQYARAKDERTREGLRVAMPIALSRAVQVAVSSARMRQRHDIPDAVSLPDFDRDHLAEVARVAAQAWADGT